MALAGNLNNELGVPLTVTRIDEQTRYLVAEMGAGASATSPTCATSHPDRRGGAQRRHAHVGEFGGQAAIAQAKGELVEALPADGVAVLNGADPLVWAMRERTTASVLAFSAEGPLDGPAVWASDLRSDPSGRYTFRLHAVGLPSPAADGETEVSCRSRDGTRSATAGRGRGGSGSRSRRAPGDRRAHRRHRAFPWRMELHQRGDGVTVLNDAYNANPDSMAAAVGTLAELSGSGQRRTWAVLGDMLELGDESERATPTSAPWSRTPGSTGWSRWARTPSRWPRRPGRRAERRGGPGVPGQGGRADRGAGRTRPRRRCPGQGVPWLSLGHRGGGDPGVRRGPRVTYTPPEARSWRTIVLAGGIALLATLFGTAWPSGSWSRRATAS